MTNDAARRMGGLFAYEETARAKEELDSDVFGGAWVFAEGTRFSVEGNGTQKGRIGDKYGQSCRRRVPYRCIYL
jgi:hypothetical protein